MLNEFITKLLGIQGFYVSKVEFFKVQVGKKGERTAVRLYLEREKKEFICNECGKAVAKGISYEEREVQHLTWWEHLTYLRIMQYRVRCPNCGLKIEALPFSDKYSRVTTALASLTAELCKVMTNSAVAIFQYLDNKTVKDIDKKAIEKAQGERSLEGITALGVDEIFVGNKVLHLISALDGANGSELLYIGKGRKEKDLKGFWKWFGKERADKITHGVMDMWKGFIKSFKANCSNIQIIYDKFHIIMHLLDVLNEVRKQVLKTAGVRLKGRLTGKKFILLSRQAHVRGKAREALNSLLACSKGLFKAYVLKESFAHLWSYKSKTWATKFWNGWKEQLKWSRLKPYKKFAQMIDSHLEGILAYCDRKLPLGFIEGTNLKARNIIRRAYGFNDEEYMKLKIIQGCSSLRIFRPWNFVSNNST